MKKLLAKKAFEFALTPLGRKIIGFCIGTTIKYWPIKKVAETSYAIAFWHPKPTHKTHILIIPKKRIKDIASIQETDLKHIEDCLLIAKKVANKLELNKQGYSLITNGGSKQKIPQLHFHLITK